MKMQQASVFFPPLGNFFNIANLSSSWQSYLYYHCSRPDSANQPERVFLAFCKRKTTSIYFVNGRKPQFVCNWKKNKARLGVEVGEKKIIQRLGKNTTE